MKIKLSDNLSKSATETIEWLRAAFGDEALTIFECHSRFQMDHHSFEFI